jgi:hypothetical protein
VLLSVVCVVLERILQLVSLLFRSADAKELEIVVLRHELVILHRQVHRTTFRPADRWFLAAAPCAEPVSRPKPAGAAQRGASTPASTGLSCNAAGRSSISDRTFKSTERPDWEMTSRPRAGSSASLRSRNSPRSGKRHRDVHQVTRQRCPATRVGNGVIQVEAETVRHAAIHVDALLL